MAKLQKSDKLNSLSSKRRKIDINDWFETMPLAPYQEQRRIALAYDIYNGVSVLLAIILADIENGTELDRQYYIDNLTKSYKTAIRENEIPEAGYEAIQEHIDDICPKIVDATLNHIKTDYFLSDDRAKVIGVEESSSVINYVEFVEAKTGGCTRKTWLTEMDERVRKTHRGVESVTIDIDDYFEVGNRLMLYPHDFENGTPEELDGCRCTIKYS